MFGIKVNISARSDNRNALMPVVVREISVYLYLFFFS